MSRRAKRSQHVTKLVNDLADVLYGEAIARAVRKPLGEYRAAADEIAEKLIRQGVTPIEVAVLMTEMREDAKKLTDALS